MMRVGIPASLLYYQYYPMWKTFFENLGVEVVLSPPTTRAMLASGSSRVVPDTCLPVKVFIGHVLSLVKECDFIFIPAICSVQQRVYNCSKFLGLPDMTRAVVPESPPILEIEIDINRDKRKLYEAIYKLGRKFSCNPLKIRRAALAAWRAHLDYLRVMSGQKIMPPLALEGMAGAHGKASCANPVTPRASIAVIGHPYLLYDELVNHRLIHRLQQENIRVLTPEMAAPGELETHINRMSGRAYWTYEREVVGAGGYYLNSEVEGVIGVMTFGCGPDSLMMEVVHREAARLGSPAFMSLTLEEHTAEAGMLTRLEAFLDMIHRKERRRTEVCV